MAPTIIHLITSSISPEPGGMQEAAVRIARSLAARESSDAVIYTRRQLPEYCSSHPDHQGLEVVHRLPLPIE